MRREEEERDDKKIDGTPILSFPLKAGHIGYMNMALQKFLGFDNKSICYNKSTGSVIDKRLKSKKYCLLRMGIEKNKKTIISMFISKCL